LKTKVSAELLPPFSGRMLCDCCNTEWVSKTKLLTVVYSTATCLESYIIKWDAYVTLSLILHTVLYMVQAAAINSSDIATHVQR
jgi:hypothetical protein